MIGWERVAKEASTILFCALSVAHKCCALACRVLAALRFCQAQGPHAHHRLDQSEPSLPATDQHASLHSRLLLLEASLRRINVLRVCGHLPTPFLHLPCPALHPCSRSLCSPLSARRLDMKCVILCLALIALAAITNGALRPPYTGLCSFQ